jgi:hypothetical protein
MARSVVSSIEIQSHCAAKRVWAMPDRAMLGAARPCPAWRVEARRVVSSIEIETRGGAMLGLALPGGAWQVAAGRVAARRDTAMPCEEPRL